MKLYEIKDDILKLLDIIENELPEDIIKEAEQWLDKLESSFDEKAFNIARYIKNLEAESLAFKTEKDRLARRQKALDNKAKGLKDYLSIMMNRLGKDKIKDDLFTLAMQNNPPSVDVIEQSKIPKEYWVEQDPVLDKKHLLKDLKEEKEIPGCSIKRTKSIRIR